MPRVLALTPGHVARVFREEADPGPTLRFTPLTDAGMEAAAADLLASKPPGPFRVFAYGSLIWNPAFEHVEARRVVAQGWRRAFCLQITRWRATPAEPGLMLALARGGACTGVAYRMPDDDPEGRMLRLLRREVSYREDLPWLRWLRVRDRTETFFALAFYCAPPGDPDVVHLDLDAQAARLARAVGHAGSCAEYLRNTVEHLEALGIHDRYLWRLQALVAAEIEALHPSPAADEPPDR
jgi:cation transport protein ChaC